MLSSLRNGIRSTYNSQGTAGYCARVERTFRTSNYKHLVRIPNGHLNVRVNRCLISTWHYRHNNNAQLLWFIQFISCLRNDRQTSCILYMTIIWRLYDMTSMSYNKNYPNNISTTALMTISFMIVGNVEHSIIMIDPKVQSSGRQERRKRRS